ncbi:MAG: efflux RND transporter periplasmic adaptor subunit [Microgenomates group bacterium]
MINFLKKRWYFLAILLLVAVIVFSTSKKNKANNEDSYVVKKQNLKEILTLSGEIDAQEKATLKFQTSGKLVWVGVKEGDYVKKYQAIASLDQRDIKNRLEKYLRAYSVTRSNFDQTKDDNWNKQYDLNEATRVRAQRILEQNQYNLEMAVLDVEYQNLALENANLWTPIEGVVTHIDVPTAGVNITPASATFEIVNPKTLYFSATVEQADVVKIKEGMMGKITLDSFADFEDQAKVFYISFSPKQGETGTVYQIKLELSDRTKNLPLRLGMTGDVEFLLKEKNNVIALPSRFIKRDNQSEYVFVKENNKKIKKYIKVGEEIDGKIIIENGLRENDIVLN